VLLGQLDEAIRSYEDSLMEDRSEEVEKLLKQTRAAKKKAERPPRDRRETAERPPRDHRDVDASVKPRPAAHLSLSTPL